MRVLWNGEFINKKKNICICYFKYCLIPRSISLLNKKASYMGLNKLTCMLILPRFLVDKHIKFDLHIFCAYYTKFILQKIIFQKCRLFWQLYENSTWKRYCDVESSNTLIYFYGDQTFKSSKGALFQYHIR